MCSKNGFSKKTLWRKKDQKSILKSKIKNQSLGKQKKNLETNKKYKIRSTIKQQL